MELKVEQAMMSFKLQYHVHEGAEFCSLRLPQIQKKYITVCCQADSVCHVDTGLTLVTEQYFFFFFFTDFATTHLCYNKIK